MALPNVTLNILDGALGIAPPNTSGVHLKVGLAPLGIINTIQSCFGSDSKTLQSLVGRGGPLAEAASLCKGQVLLASVNPSTYGTVGAVTKVASNSTGALAIAAEPFTSIIGKVSTAGPVGTAKVQFSTDGGNTYGAPVLTASTVMCPQAPFITFAFAAGAYVVADFWTVAVDGTVVFTGTGENGLTVSSVSPVDAYSVIVDVVTAGAFGTAQFVYSLDGGNTFSATITVPSAGTYVIPDTGLKLTFSSAPLGNQDQWTCTVTGASYSSGDLTTCLNVVTAPSQQGYGFLHLVGAAASVAASATLAATVEGILDTAAANYRFVRALLEVPQDTDANIEAAFASTVAVRVNGCGGYETVVSPLNGRQQSRNIAWTTASRAAAVPVSVDLGRYADGPLSNITALTRDENATPGLDASRFTTHRTFTGVPGVYVTTGRLLAAAGSDYSLWQNGRVIDVAATTTRLALLQFLNSSLRINPNGTINEKDARRIEDFATSALQTALTQPGDASAVQVIVNRTANILANQTLPVSVRVLPIAYSKIITVDLGFTTSIQS